MSVTREQLVGEYRANKYESFLRLFEEYRKTGYGIDFTLAYYYVYSLITIREFDRAYSIIQEMEKGIDKYPDIIPRLFNLYYFCFRSLDAERMYLKGNKRNFNSYNVINNLLLLGKIEEAEKQLETAADYLSPYQYVKLKNQIFNHNRHNAFVETSYDAFINNGNELEQGYIVFLKHSPNTLTDAKNDEKAALRPYLIWKCEGDNLFVFPLSTNREKGRYVLFSQYYPNCGLDRIVKDSLCQTTTDNVLAVYDKLRDEDMRPTFASLYDRMYLSKFRDEKIANEKFLQEFKPKIELHNLIRMVDLNGKGGRLYYVVDVNDRGYRIVEVDRDLNLLSTDINFLNKDCLVYRVSELTEEQIAKLNSKLPNYLNVRNFIGARIDTISGKYIVLYENENYTICIGSVYSASYMNIVPIKKSEVLNVIGYLSYDEVVAIREMVKRNSKVSINSLLKHNK